MAQVSKERNSLFIGNPKSLKKKVIKGSRKDIIRYAELFIGVDYKWGGDDSSGMDCSGFIQRVMVKNGYYLNHSAKDQSEKGKEISIKQATSGDLIFFGKKYTNNRFKIDHVAIVHHIENKQVVVIHCTSKGTNIQKLVKGDYWSRRLLFIKNIID